MYTDSYFYWRTLTKGVLNVYNWLPTFCKLETVPKLIIHGIFLQFWLIMKLVLYSFDRVSYNFNKLSSCILHRNIETYRI